MDDWKVTKVGKIPFEWDVKSIGQISERVSVGFVGTTSPYFTTPENGVPLLRSQNIRNGRLNLNNLAYVTKEFHQKNKNSILKPGDVIVVRVGENRGDTCILTNEFDEVNCANVVFFRPDTLYAKFVELYLRSPYGQYVLDSLTTGSAQGVINTKSIEQILIPIPSLEEVKSISQLFHSIERKIDLLNRQNRNIADLTENLFRLSFQIEGKKLVTLDNYVSCINGYSYKSSELEPSKNALVTLKNFDRNGGFRLDGFKEFTGKIKEAQTVKEGDLVVAHTDITQEAEVIGNPALIIADPHYEVMVITMDLVKVLPKFDWLSIEFLYFLMKSREFKFHCLGCSNGTTVLHLSKRAIPSFEFQEPNKDAVIEFTSQAKPLLQKVFSNHRQIKTLTQLRDTLLPKLMSGEVRIESMQEELALV